jgi:hypothetical protein
MKQLLILETHLRVFWAARNTRERLILVVGIVVAIIAMYITAISAVNKKIAGLQHRLPELLLNNYEIASGSKALPQRAKRAGDLRSDLFKILAERKLQADLRAISPTQVEMRMPDQDAKTLLDNLNTIRLSADAHVTSLQLRVAEKGSTGATATLERTP